ncbi:MAG: glycosyl hydrolase 53 family protein [Phycisphaerales bacterium]|nr:glycosyl hydrolase 53 family protein [Phycisphaerales bacterium]
MNARARTLLVGTLALWLTGVYASAQPDRPAARQARLDTPAPLPGSRPFRMGFTTFPYDVSLEAVENTYGFINEHADLVLFHHDHGVPWTEALSGLPYHPNLVAEINAEVARIRPQQRVFVSATMQSQARAAELADYWGQDIHMPLPPQWQGLAMDHPDVIEAYTNWCRYLIDRFDPDYFAYGIETNGGFVSPDDPGFVGFTTLVQQVYTTLKADYPDLPVLLSVQTGSTASTREDFLEITNTLLDSTDIVGISTYPYFLRHLNGWDSYTDPRALPDDFLTAITQLAPEKPVAISETGYIAQDLDIPAYGMFIPGSSFWQMLYVRTLLLELTALDAEFVTWFVSRDYDLMQSYLDEHGIPYGPEFFIWRDNGLLDGNGAARPALTEWDRWLALPLDDD